MPYLSVTSYLCQSQHNFISLVPRPPPFSTSVCVYNNTWERKTGIFIFRRSSNSVYFYERKETIETGEAWDWDYNIIILFTSSPPCLSNWNCVLKLSLCRICTLAFFFFFWCKIILCWCELTQLQYDSQNHTTLTVCSFLAAGGYSPGMGGFPPGMMGRGGFRPPRYNTMT